MNDIKIRTLCQDYGLAVAGLDAQGEVLVVVPHSLDELPTADRLAELADKLRDESGCRYVTIGLDEAMGGVQ